MKVTIFAAFVALLMTGCLNSPPTPPSQIEGNLTRATEGTQIIQPTKPTRRKIILKIRQAHRRMDGVAQDCADRIEHGLKQMAKEGSQVASKQFVDAFEGVREYLKGDKPAQRERIEQILKKNIWSEEDVQALIRKEMTLFSDELYYTMQYTFEELRIDVRQKKDRLEPSHGTPVADAEKPISEIAQKAFKDSVLHEVKLIGATEATILAFEKMMRKRFPRVRVPWWGHLLIDAAVVLADIFVLETEKFRVEKVKQSIEETCFKIAEEKVRGEKGYLELFRKMSYFYLRYMEEYINQVYPEHKIEIIENVEN